jgi:fibronectin-binding autotransporter adhesin
MKPLSTPRPWLTLLAICGASFLASTARVAAVDGTWTNPAGGTLAWTNTTNWSGGTRPDGIDAIANFATINIAVNTTVTLASTNPTVGTMLFNDTSGAQTWGINNTGTLNLSVSSGSPIISNGVTTTINAVLAGSQGLTKIGSAVLIIGGSNTYSGNTTISDGALRLGASDTLADTSVVVFSNNSNNKELTVFSATDTIGGLVSSGGAGTIVVQNNRALNSGTLNLNVAASTSLTYDGVIRDSGTNVSVNNLNIIKSGTGTQVFSGGANVSYSGATTVSNGVLEFAGATVNNNTAIQVISGATMRFNNSSTLDRTLAITGAGNVEKSGSGVLTLSGSNTYTGSTIMSAGNLRLGASERIADTSIMRFTGGGGSDSRFQMMGFSETLGGLNSELTTGTQVIEGATTAAATLTLGVASGSLNYSGVLRDSSGGTNANNLSLVKNGAGTQVLSGSVSYSGATTINGGALELAGTVNDNTAINVTNSAAAVRFNIASGNLGRTNTISGSGSVAKSGAGAVTFSNANTYTGATVLEEGFIRLAASERIADASVLRFATTTDARFQMQGFSETLGGLDSGSSIGTQVVEGATNAAATLTLSVGSGSYTYTGFLRDAVSGTNANNLSLVKNGAGTQVLSGGDSLVGYSGVTTVNGGVLEFAGATVNNNTAINVAGSSAVIRFNHSTNATRSNTITGAGGLEKSGAATLTLSGSNANTYSGVTTISGGTLNLNKTAGTNAIAGSSVVVGSGATLLVSASNQVIDSASVSLSGGTIQRGSGVSERFGDLSLTASSSLNFGNVAQSNFLQFGAFAPGAFTLNVSGFRVGNELRYNAADLAAGQALLTSSIAFSGSDGFSTSFGSGVFTITAIPEPSTVAVAVALAGFFGLSMWRRRPLSPLSGSHPQAGSPMPATGRRICKLHTGA